MAPITRNLMSWLARRAAAIRNANNQPTKRVGQDIASLEKAKNATVSADGTERSRTTRRGETETVSTLKRTEGQALESSFEYTRTTRKPGLERDTTFRTDTDLLGRRSSSQVVSETRESEQRVDSKVSGRATDVWGIEKRTLEKSAEVDLGNGTESTRSRTARDSEGNKVVSSETERVVTEGKTTTTTTGARAKGSELDTQSEATYRDGVFRLSEKADWSRTNSFERGVLRETEYDASKQKERADKLGSAAEKALNWLGLEPAQWRSTVSADRMHEKTLAEGGVGSVTARYGISGGQEVSFDGRGVDASFNRTAVAGVSADAAGYVEGRFGSAGYDAHARAEAEASIDATAHLDTNGLTAEVDARVGAKVEVEINAEARTRTAMVLGTPVDASVSAHGVASAEATAEATGRIAITRDPPTAIAEGSAGASAVAKAEGTVAFSAGPFSVNANGYVSAGAEARASGVIGYSDGKLRLGGSLGAAVGVGAGAGINVEVDVRQIGQMAKNAADVNHDGKLDYKDAFEAVKRTASFAMPVLGLFHR